jgi:hypothetical protein
MKANLLWPAVVLLIAVALFPTLIATSQGGEALDETRDSGFLALRLLSEELQLDVALRETLPEASSDTTDLALLLPASSFADLDRDSDDQLKAELRRVMRNDGWVIALCEDQADVDFVTKSLATQLSGWTIGKPTSSGLRRTTLNGEALELSDPRVQRLSGTSSLARRGGFEAWQLANGSTGTARTRLDGAAAIEREPVDDVVVLLRPLNRGGLVVTTLGSSWSNAELARDDNAVFWTRLLERLTDGDLARARLSIVLDPGRAQHRTWVGYLLRPPLVFLTLAAALLLALGLWILSQPTPFPLSEPLPLALTARARATGLANLMRRSGHTTWPESVSPPTSHD